MEIDRSAARRAVRPIALAALLAAGPGVSPAFAYLDPGTGSMLLQLLLGGVAGAMVVGRLYMRRVGDLFRKAFHPRRSK